MYFFFILFFASLAGVIFMVGKKLRALQNGAISDMEAIHFEAPNFDQVRIKLSTMAQRFGYFLLVEAIRAYVRVAIFMKKEWADAKAKVNKFRNKEGVEIAREPNRFLKTVGEYKRKIGKIKAEIKEEENL